MSDPLMHLIIPTGMPKVYTLLARVPAEPEFLYLAMICPTNAKVARLRDHRGPVLGGIARTSTGWAVVAYADRNHFTGRTGHFAFLEDTATLSDAAAQLIQHWRKSPSTRRKISTA